MKTTNDYERIDTTTGINGYPKEVQTALYGFESADELNKFAQEHQNEGEIITIHRRDGWKLWERGNYGTFAEDTDVTADMFGDDCCMFATTDEIEQEIEFVKNEYADMDDEDGKSYVAKCLNNLEHLKEIFKKYCNDGNHQVRSSFSSEYENWDIEPIKTFGRYYDTHYYGYAFLLFDEG